MLKFRIWVDADSFPKKARESLISITKTNSVSVIFVSNRPIPFSPSDNHISMIISKNEKGSADDYIFENAKENDIVVTRDIPFASRLIEKSICVMNDRGIIFNKDNIEDRLREREFSLNLAEIGLGGKKENYYSDKELKKFTQVFSQELQKHITIEIYNIKRY
ncbi:DUF188 domain-containing protein [Treponema sp.]|uniref:DUF188 domain-containing protein n=1 Tax=Treponema sp. TaxID=166 RepID=UPI003890711C